MFFASIRTFRMPSLSARTSSGLLPCTIFQYREEMTGICPQRKNLFSWSSVAVVPARLAHKCGQCSGGSGIVDRRAKEEAVIVPGNRQEIIDTILKHTASLLSAPPAVNTALYWLGSDPKQIRAHSLAAKHGCDLG